MKILQYPASWNKSTLKVIFITFYGLLNFWNYFYFLSFILLCCHSLPLDGLLQYSYESFRIYILKFISNSFLNKASGRHSKFCGRLRKKKTDTSPDFKKKHQTSAFLWKITKFIEQTGLETSDCAITPEPSPAYEKYWNVLIKTKSSCWRGTNIETVFFRMKERTTRKTLEKLLS